ncbi:MAG: AraC family transcriptional regulator [Burkholderiales bacterium]|uniref:helix-turn-helix transcriptional regulator n=1 Tax=Ottowia sp. TaxID=1898956 RepID=UPI001AC681C3|nr:AraC family transcriptional regulator [Ottowia sp.]MBN9404538.1 AraC family transcriptional regulator [Burkholderiales bacterium]MBS0414631.1 AraC family transcriptional regulator [Pseudomonadota bacterium]
MPPPPPPTCALEHWDSSALAPAERLAYWHDVAHNWVDVQPLSPGEQLQASWSLLRGADCFFGTKQSSAYEMRTAARHVPPGEDMVVISLLQSGQMRLNAAPGEHQHASAGMLGLYVPYQDACYRWGAGARQTYIALPRREVAAALGREPTNMAIALAQCALAPLLASQLSHLSLLARQPEQLDEYEYAGLLDATRALTLLTLRNLGRQGRNLDRPDAADPQHRGRHAAALRFMQQHAHRHDLHADAIAHGAGCSRTRLYEAFAARGETVMGTLRELRLQRARALIEQGSRLNVGALSWRCGFADPSGFSKLFRARFGLAPTEWHQQARAARPM